MSAWNSIAGKVCRWILFLPVGLLAAALLESIPIFAFQFAANYELRFTLLTVIVTIFVSAFVLGGIAYWFAGVVLLPTLACGRIAPTPKVASVMFGTLFCFFQGVTLWGMVRGEAGWGIITYKIVFSVLLVIGIVVTHTADEESVPASQTSTTETESLQGATQTAQEVDPFTMLLPTGDEQKLMDRVSDYVASEFTDKELSYRIRALKYIQNRLKIAARRHYAEHQTLKGFRDADELRIAAAEFSEMTGRA
jgi:hypothetical protein